jgi:hypothetical protein
MELVEIVRENGSNLWTIVEYLSFETIMVDNNLLGKIMFNPFIRYVEWDNGGVISRIVRKENLEDYKHQ